MCFCAGAVARGMMKKSKYEKCHSLLISSRESLTVQFEEEDELSDAENAAKVSFLKRIDRGGLSVPSDLVYLACIFANNLREEIFLLPELTNVLLTAKSPGKTFVMCFENWILASESMNALLSQEGDNGHLFLSFVPRIGSFVLNLTSKNYAQKLNDDIHAAKSWTSSNMTNRKLAKLLVILL